MPCHNNTHELQLFKAPRGRQKFDDSQAWTVPFVLVLLCSHHYLLKHPKMLSSTGRLFQPRLFSNRLPSNKAWSPPARLGMGLRARGISRCRIWTSAAREDDLLHVEPHTGLKRAAAAAAPLVDEQEKDNVLDFEILESELW